MFSAPSTSRFRSRLDGRRALVALLVYLPLLAYAALSVFPFLTMVSAAFKDDSEVTSNVGLIPHNPTLQAVKVTWTSLDLLVYVRNSIAITVISLLAILLIFPLAAYAFALLRFPCRRVLFGLFVALLFVPAITVLLPIVLLNDKLGLLGTRWGVIFPLVNGASPVALVLLRRYFESIPRELHEAARLDGCSEFKVFTTIYFPLARPALVAVAVLNFVGIWNEYVLSSVTLSDPEKFTLPLGLQQLLSTSVVQWNVVMAGALFVVLPVVAVFLVLQRYFVAGLSGSIK